MPAWNLGELMSNVTQALGNRSDIATSTVSFYVNVGYEDVWNSLPHDAQEALAISSTTVNENRITLPSDFQELINLSNVSRQNALLGQLNQDQVASFSAFSGVPTNFALFDSWLELCPVPDSAYSMSMRYRKLRSDLTALTSVPSVATRLRPAIMYRATELMAQNVTLDASRQQQFSVAYMRALNELPSDRALQQRNEHAQGCSLGRYRGSTTRTSSVSFDTSI